MDFKKEKYSNKIKGYYTTKLDKQFFKRIIDYFWLDGDLLKENIELVRENKSRKIKVFKLNHQGKCYYLKLYSYQRISKKIQNNLLRRPEGIRNLKLSKTLLEEGISTAKPIFSAVKLKLICFDSIFVTEEVSNIELEKYVKDNELRKNEIVLKTSANFWSKIINNNFVHQDPGLDNIFIDFDKDEVKLTLIDIDDIYSVPFLPTSVAVHILARFLAKTCICLHRYNKATLSIADFNLFLLEFIEGYNKKINLDKITSKLSKLIIKKVIKRDYEDIINSSDLLSTISNRYNLY